MKYLYYIFRLFFTPKCKHNWDIECTGDITDGTDIVGNYYNLKCNKCGDLKRKNFKS